MSISKERDERDRRERALNLWPDDGLPYCDPYDVTCARCGQVLPCDKAMIEEGDEWECEPCWERCESEERIACRGLDFDVGAS